MAVLTHFGSPEDCYYAEDYSDLELSRDAAASLQNKELKEAEDIFAACEKKKIHILTFGDSQYPSILRNIIDPPMVLYYKGTLPDFESTAVIGVVGTRKASLYGMNTARRMGYQISRCGGMVVSGMAAGIDGAATAGALTAGGAAVGVLGCGVDVVYPVSNRQLFQQMEQFGCLISEFVPDTPPYKWNFPRRNRILSEKYKNQQTVRAK
jgi:DNA processing protein